MNTHDRAIFKTRSTTDAPIRPVIASDDTYAYIDHEERRAVSDSTQQERFRL